MTHYIRVISHVRRKSTKKKKKERSRTNLRFMAAINVCDEFVHFFQVLGSVIRWWLIPFNAFDFFHLTSISVYWIWFFFFLFCSQNYNNWNTDNHNSKLHIIHKTNVDFLSKINVVFFSFHFNKTEQFRYDFAVFEYYYYFLYVFFDDLEKTKKRTIVLYFYQ